MDDYETGGGQAERPPRYPGEDVTPTSERELRGWYTYGLAAEVFAVCGVGSFLPITLEQLARGRGVLLADGVTACVPEATANAGAGNSTLVRSLFLRDETQPVDDTCVIHLFGAQINTASFAMYTFSLAVLCQALIVVSFSSMADYGNNRKTLLVVFGFTGGIATMLFLIVFPQIYLLASILVIVGVTCLGSSFVILNSFLPTLAANHPSIRHGKSEEYESSSSSIPLGRVNRASDESSRSIPVTQEYEPASNLKEPHKKSISPELQLSSQISSKGVGIGYAAAVFVQILSILLIFLLSKTSISSTSPTLPLRLVLFLVGTWWSAFTLVSRFWLRNRPGPPLHAAISKHGNSWRSWLPYITFAWASLWRTIKVAAKLRQVVIFLIAWFLLSDCIATVSGTAILFAKTELKMATVAVACLSILATTSGIVGAFSWPRISRRFGMNSQTTILACIALFEIIPLYGLAGYIPFVQRWGVGGLQRPWEIYPLGFVHGFVMGGLSSYCRSFFGQLIPPGSEAAFFALYAVTDKGSSVFGPAVVGRIVDATGHIRPAFIFLAVLMVLPMPLVWVVNEERGRKDAVAMAETLKGFDKGAGRESPSPAERSEEREGLLAEDE
ncbi:MAG: Autophagy protein 22 [Claussenomyces sp. TS43310]|nr:MAG: Autophagy protein 22 [Claussenomyces sp. TS43310]